MNPLPLLMPQLAARIAVWLIEFGACLTGPVVGHGGEFCIRYDVNEWPHYDGFVDLRDYARAQNMWFCADPFGCRVRR